MEHHIEFGSSDQGSKPSEQGQAPDGFDKNAHKSNTVAFGSLIESTASEAGCGSQDEGNKPDDDGAGENKNKHILLEEPPIGFGSSDQGSKPSEQGQTANAFDKNAHKSDSAARKFLKNWNGSEAGGSSQDEGNKPDHNILEEAPIGFGQSDKGSKPSEQGQAADDLGQNVHSNPFTWDYIINPDTVVSLLKKKHDTNEGGSSQDARDDECNEGADHGSGSGENKHKHILLEMVGKEKYNVDVGFERNAKFEQDYKACTEAHKCFMCNESIRYSNSPCECYLWCSQHADWARDIVRSNRRCIHKCIICDAAVESINWIRFPIKISRNVSKQKKKLERKEFNKMKKRAGAE